MKTKYFLFLFLFVIVLQIFSQANYYYYPIQSGTTNNLTYIYSISSYNSYITGANGTLLQSTNSSATIWNPVTLGTTNNLNGIMIRNNFTYSPANYILGNNGTMYISTNTGGNWSQVNCGVTGNLRAGFLVTGDSVWHYKYLIVGDGGIMVYKKIFNDSAWHVISSVTTSNLMSTYFIGKYGWIAGSNGTILKSTNSGLNWIVQTSGVTNDLNSILFTSTSNGVAVGNDGMILRTTNGGTNWSQVMSGTTQKLNQVISQGSSDSTNLWIVGNSGIILNSTNAGLNWSAEVYAPNINFNSGHYMYDYLFVVGNGGNIYKRALDTCYHNNNPIIMEGNNIRSFFINRGIFDQNTTTNGHGFEWPKNSGTYAMFSAGLTIAAKVNGAIRMAAASYKGEYAPGYCINGVFHTDSYFKFYKVTRGDNAQTNWDWANWGLMVPYGAPYVDVNNNGIYEPAIDTPGVRNAKETMFICLTDADFSKHTSSEGFSGGTTPLGVELHMIIWVYDNPPFLQDVQFISYDIINKSTNTWNAVKMGIVCDPDIGDANDDYIGCDTLHNLGFCYNGDNYDNIYGTAPPAVGMTLLRGPLNRSITPNIRLKMTSFNHMICISCNPPICEHDPESPSDAYHFISGYKRDSTCWLDPTQNPPQKTKFIYTGDPELNAGWTEVKGSIWNCGGDTTGVVNYPNPIGDRRYIMGSGADNFNIVPGESQKFVIAQLIARGSSNLNSVTLLKNLTSQVISFYETNFPIVTNLVSISGNVKYQDNSQTVTIGSIKAFRLDLGTGQIIVLDSTGIQSDGSYILNNIPQGDVYIGAVPNSTVQVDYVPTYYPSAIYWQNATVLYPTGNLTNINVRVFRLTSLVTSNNANGTVYSSDPVAPLKSVNLYAKNGNTFVGFTTTGSSGNYNINSLPSGSLKIIADRIGYKSDSVTINLSSGTIDSVNFYLVRLFINIKQISSETPDKYLLYQNYPNPFNPSTNIKYQITKNNFITLKVFDILGKEIITLVSENQKPGLYEVKFDAKSLSSGIYFYQIIAGDFIQTKRMILLK